MDEEAMKLMGTNDDLAFDPATMEKMLGVKPVTQRQARKKGLLRYARVGTGVIYLGKWVREWLERIAQGGE